MLHGMVFAMGLEGAFTASHGVSLTPALTQALDLPVGRKTVIEAYTSLTIKNQHGRFLRSRRFSRSMDFDPKLVQVWIASSRLELESAEVEEYFVRHPGSAVSQRGFHQLLADFLGCDLPTVPAHGGGESLLYLELLLPLFFVEQKFGWSGIAPRVRTNMKVREPLKRGVEYVLGLSTLDRIKSRNRLRDQLADLRRRWEVSVQGLLTSCVSEGQRVIFLAEDPVGPSKLRAPLIEAYVDGEWIPADLALLRWQEQLQNSPLDVQTVEGRTESSIFELETAENEAIRLGVDVRRLQERRSLLEAEGLALENRFRDIESNKRQLEDARLVMRFGGVSNIPVLSNNLCPTCEQDIDGQETAFGQAFSLDDNIAFLKAEADAVRSMQVAVLSESSSLNVTLSALQSTMSATRQRIRLLRDELTSPSSMPSIAQLQEDLALRAQVRSLEGAQVVANDAYDQLESLSIEYQEIRASLDALKGGDLSDGDMDTIADFQNTFRSQLREYGLRSVSPKEVTISPESLLPDNDGFDLNFSTADMDAKVSASDTIRTKWAYVTSLYEVSSRSLLGRHPGVLVLDEPRQQEVDRQNVMSFIRRLATSATSGQVIYVTSEELSIVEDALAGSPVHFLPAEGNHLFSS